MTGVSSDEAPARIVYDADWEPGEIAGIDGEGLEVGRRVILVQPEGVTEEPLEWPGVVEEVRERIPGNWWAGVRMHDPNVTVSRDDLRLVLDYARHFDVDDDPAVIRVSQALNAR
jgi:hypothetical protein